MIEQDGWSEVTTADVIVGGIVGLIAAIGLAWLCMALLGFV